MRARIALPDPALLTAEGQEIHRSILETRGNVEGPFLAWLHSPGLAGPAQQLGAFCRYGTLLAPDESELLILLVAAHFDCSAEWAIHAPIALRAGIAQAAVNAIARREPPAAPDLTPRQHLLTDFTTQLLTTNRVDDIAFAAVTDTFGTQATVELVGVIGYYSLVAMTLNAFAMTVA
jgi:4-carboxymuconolactone decarboxylase